MKKITGMRKKGFALLLAICLGSAGLLAGCGSDGPGTAASAGAESQTGDQADSTA